MKELGINASDCSSDELIRTAKKCGLVVKSGKKHYKVEDTDGQFVTTIPRHSRLKRELVKGIVEKFNQFGIRKVNLR